jgi:hypothetical protein
MYVLITPLKPIHQTEPTDRLPDPQPLDRHPALSRIGLSPQRTSRVINRHDNASEALMEACSQLFDMPIDELFNRGGRDGF